MNWLRALPELLAHQDVVLVTVAQTRGSVPREAGASMLVTLDSTTDTIGGGHLEWEAMAQARAMLLQLDEAPALQRLSLGASLGQCCGGVVWLVFERIAQNEREVWVERSRLIDAGSLLTRTLSDFEEVSHTTIGSPDEAQRNPGASLETYHPPSPAPDGAPSPSGRGDGNARARLRQSPLPQVAATATSTPDASSPLSQAWERVPRHGRERGNASSTRTSAGSTPDANPNWRLTHHLTPPTFNITLFGAGHVGAAIVKVLSTLDDANIRWVDVRDDLFGTPPNNVKCITTDTPEDEVDHTSPDTFFLVLTYSHALDLALTTRILKRDAFAWFGLIGSRTKRARFEHRLQAQGIASAQLARMVCPIGVAGMSDKAPAAIAIAVVAQLLQAKELHDRHLNHRELAHERS